jgi:hypothetical protein
MLLAYGCQSDLVDQLNSAGASAREPVDHVDAGAPSDRDAGPAGSEPVAQDDDAGATNGPNPTVRVCRPGTFVTEDSTVAEVRCEGCPSGTYSTEEDADQCQQWTECQPGEFVKNKGSATKDQTCEACAGDQTSTAVNAGTCLPVDACPSGTVQVSAAQDGGTAQCEPCDSGSYCAGGTTPAHPCAEGTWDHDEDPATDCVEQTNCPEGQYVTDPGDATSDRSCKDCAKGSFSLSTNATECVAQVECPEGTFRESDGTSAGDVICTACPAGTYTDAADLAECAPWTECPPGQFVSVDGSATADRVCEPCADGEFSSTPNAASCMADGECMPGTRQTEAGTPDRASVCEDCVPGEYCAGADTPAEGCAASTWDHDQDPSTPCVEQTTCLAGSYLVAMGDATTDLTCGPCEDGSFSVDENVLACQSWQVCPEGTYVQTLGSATSDVACAGCASGTFSAQPGSASCGAFSDCQPGQYVQTAGTASSDRVCATCPAGQYSSSINAGMCVDVGQCAPGTVETVPATQSSPAQCADCSPGSYCAGGQATEVACDASSWDDDQDPATPCISKTTCAPGQYVAGAGSTTTDRSCTACASGKFSATQNAASCQSWQTCAAGKYVQTAGSSTADRVCTTCASGTFSTTQNAASCTTWSTCTAPTYRMTNSPNATTDRQCAACTAPQVTSTNNETTCHVPAFQMSGGTVVMEAENYTVYDQNSSSHTWSSVGVSGISGGTAMQLPDWSYQWDPSGVATSFSPLLSYNINFTTTGTFYVFIRADDAGGAGNDNSCWAGIDGTPISSYFDFPTSANSWIWVSKQVTVSTTGAHTFTVWGREDGFRFDKIVISKSSTAPSGNGPAESPYN